jgi:hypothetical protein
VHPTSGSLRVFKRFAWLEVGSVKMALSHPAHQRVTHTVSPLNHFNTVRQYKMNFLPYEDLKIRTRLSTKEAWEKLHEAIEPKRFVGWLEVNYKPYHGDLNDFHFEVARAIRYSNPSLPIIRGDIRPEAIGCSIHITMRPIGFVIAVMLILLGIVCNLFLSAIGSLISSALQGNVNDPSILVVVGGMFAAIYTFFVGPFKFESIQAKEFFCELLQAEEVEEMGITNPFKVAG